MTHRPTLFALLDEAAPRIARMGDDAIAECHALGVPAWIEDRETGRIVRLDPDGTRHFEEPRPYSTQGLDVLRAIRPVRRPEAYVPHDLERDLGESPPTAQEVSGPVGGRPRGAARFASEVQVDGQASATRDGEGDRPDDPQNRGLKVSMD